MNPIYWFCRASARLLLFLLWRWKRHDVDRIPMTGPLLICSNHASNLDPPIIGCMMRRETNFLAKRELMTFKPMEALLRALNSIPIKRGAIDRTATREVLRRLQLGQSVVTFPEGTRSRTGRLGEARVGIGKLATDAQVPILPVFIAGSYQWWKSLFRWRGIEVFCGNVIPPQELARYGDGRSAYEAVAGEIMRQISELCPFKYRKC